MDDVSRFVIPFRHGKAELNALGPDHERKLAKRGLVDARRMGRYLAESGQLPDLVLTSTATRAATTARLAAEAGGWNCEIRELRAIYEAGAAELFQLVFELPASVHGLVVVGHQPTLSSWVARLTGGVPPAFPTATMARVDVPIEHWRDLRAGCGLLRWLQPPRLLPGSGGASG